LDLYSTTLWHLQNEVALSALAQDLVETDRTSPQVRTYPLKTTILEQPNLKKNIKGNDTLPKMAGLCLFLSHPKNALFLRPLLSPAKDGRLRFNLKISS